MHELKIFKNEIFGEVRIVVEKDKPYFNLNDICGILELKNSRDVKNRLNEGGVVISDTPTSSGVQPMNYIDESNLYKCIFRSRKKEAEQFTDWVTSEVLPMIRKTGMYVVDDLLDNPDLAIKAFTKLKEEREKRKVLEKKIEKDRTKIEFYEDVTGCDSTCDMQIVAKLLNFSGVGRNTLFEILRNETILQKDNIPYQKYVDKGWFRIVETKYNDCKTGDVKMSFKTVVYQKGIEAISKLLKELNYEKNKKTVGVA